jgi:hypothetical protein
MANLFGQNVGTNYVGILNLGNGLNTPVSTTLEPITDGDGTTSSLSISTKSIVINNKINIGNSAEEPTIFNVSPDKENINISVNTNTIVVSNTYSTGSYDSGATPPDNTPSAIFEMASTTKGMLLPRMTTSERTNIKAAADGLKVYDKELHLICYYDTNAVSWYSLDATQI